MSNIFISNIVGTGTYGVPANDAALIVMNQAFFDLVNGMISDFSIERAIAWVKDSAGPDGAEGVRTLNCLFTGAVYDLADCPTEAEADTLFAELEAVFLAAGGGGTITSVGVMEYNMVAYT